LTIRLFVASVFAVIAKVISINWRKKKR